MTTASAVLEPMPVPVIPEPLDADAEPLDAERCWRALEARDANSDGEFLYGVITTGVYCRPSCGSRLPLRKNVRFYRSAAEAQHDGLRACRRCHPDAGDSSPTNVELIGAICRYVDAHSDQPLTLGALARQAGLSRFHFQRTFKAIVGLTPREYVERARLKTLRRELREARDVADAAYGSGYNSLSRIYERAGQRLGMSPGQYRAGGKRVQITYTVMKSSLGLLLVGATDRGVCSVQFGESEPKLVEVLKAEYPAATVQSMKDGAHGHLRQWAAALERHLAGSEPHLRLPVDVRASAFQALVWNYLQSLPYGETRSYCQVAEAVGRPSAARAVARACASNPVALLIPCHRVIRGTGELGGYRWGLGRKQALLEHEKASTAGAAR